MKLPLGMMTLFLKSMGAPESVVSMLDHIDAQGFTAFTGNPIRPDDPTWAHLQADPNKPRNGLWLRAAGPDSRLTMGLFFEGENNEILSALASDTGVRVLPTVDEPAPCAVG